MTKGALGWWAVRFLAAAGVSGVACSATHLENNAGSGGRGGTSVAGKSGEADPVAGAGSGNAASGGEPDVAEPAGGGAGVGGTLGAAGGADQSPPDDNYPSPDNPFPCLNPVPYGNPESGLELCDNGMVHRVSEGTCATAASDARGGCTEDADCGPFGHFGSICFCNAEGAGHCAPADCTTDADCADGFACVAPTDRPCANGVVGFVCEGPNDKCGTATTCHDCMWSSNAGAQVRECVTCGVGGRPFLVEATPRTARTQASAAWLEPSVQASTEGLPPELRVALALHWQHQAEMEHASVAAFARFVLELLSLGAPPDLVTAATDALADETAHARVCYALASGYAGQALGPTGLDVNGALADLSLEGIVTRAVLEGCVGETLAALEMSEAANHTADQALRDELSRIAEDEARHAELSWRFLGWALSKAGAELHHVVRSAFHRAEAELRTRLAESVPSRSTDAALLAHGVLPSVRAAQLALDVYRTVIEPCAGALLAAPSPNGDVAVQTSAVSA